MKIHQIFDDKTRLKVTTSYPFRQIWSTFLVVKLQWTHELFKHVLNEKYYLAITQTRQCVLVPLIQTDGVKWLHAGAVALRTRKSECVSTKQTGLTSLVFLRPCLHSGWLRHSQQFPRAVEETKRKNESVRQKSLWWDEKMNVLVNMYAEETDMEPFG